ncbi:hypothetical protein FHG87_015867 [Trinorchestia longiramus]|nr:hypothetical protein FHG87_015867 [Trinorchestia longiramus]
MVCDVPHLLLGVFHPSHRPLLDAVLLASPPPVGLLPCSFERYARHAATGNRATERPSFALLTLLSRSSGHFLWLCTRMSRATKTHVSNLSVVCLQSYGILRFKRTYFVGSVTGAGDPEIDEHFRRSLGKTYHHIFDAAASATPSADPAPAVVPAAPAGAAPARDVRHKKQAPPQQPPPPQQQPPPQRQSPTTPPRVPSTDSVDDHFAKALGATWTELQALRNNTPPPPPPPPSYSSSTVARSSTNSHPTSYNQPHVRGNNSDAYSSLYKTSSANGILRSSGVSGCGFNGSLTAPATCGPSSSPVSSLATLSIVPIGRSSSRSSSPSVTSPATITRVVSSARPENEANARVLQSSRPEVEAPSRVLQSFRPENEANSRVSPSSMSESKTNSHFISSSDGEPIALVLSTSRPDINASISRDRRVETDLITEYPSQALKARPVAGSSDASRPSSPENGSVTSKSNASSPSRATANSCSPESPVNESIKSSASLVEVNDHGASISKEKPDPMST